MASTPRRLPIAIGIIGALVVLTYLATALHLIDGIDRLLLVGVFLIGPVGVAGVLAIGDQLAPERDDPLVRLGVVLLVVGFALFAVMIVVQQMVSLQMRAWQDGAQALAERQLVGEIHRGVNLVQLGVDVAFDLFYTLGIVCFGSAMLTRPAFGKPLGLFGIISAAALLGANLYTFPALPAEAGLIDLGPVTGLWWLLVMARLVGLRRTPGGGGPTGQP